MVIGGFAMIRAGFPRTTMDIDILMEATPENEARVFAALSHLPDQAVKDLEPGDVDRYSVVRVADEIVVDLMKSACGIEYREAITEVAYEEIQGVRIPFAGPDLLWKMKSPTQREKDQPDLLFLRMLFFESGREPPAPNR